MELKNKIGITGKSGVGKSVIARYLGDSTGIEVLSFDDVVVDIFNKPIMQFACKTLIGKKLSERRCVMETMGDWGRKVADNKFGHVPIRAFKFILNNRLKKIIAKNDKPMIVEFVLLPELDIANQFGTKLHIVGDDRLRKINIARREEMSSGEAESFSHFADLITNYDTMDYNKTISNDYNGIPQEIQELAANINRNCLEI